MRGRDFKQFPQWADFRSKFPHPSPPKAAFGRRAFASYLLLVPSTCHPLTLQYLTRMPVYLFCACGALTTRQIGSRLLRPPTSCPGNVCRPGRIFNILARSVVATDMFSPCHGGRNWTATVDGQDTAPLHGADRVYPVGPNVTFQRVRRSMTTQTHHVTIQTWQVCHDCKRDGTGMHCLVI